MEEQVDNCGGLVSPAGRKEKRKTEPIPQEQERTKKQRQEALRRRPQKRQLYDEMVVKACLRKRIRDPYKERLRDAIRNLVDSYSKKDVKTSSGLAHLAKEMYEDVAHMETVEGLGEFFNMTIIRRLMLGTGESSTKKELVQALHENFAEFRFEGTQYRGDRNIYTCGAMKFIMDVKNHLTMNLERFMIRTVFALYPGISRKGK